MRLAGWSTVVVLISAVFARPSADPLGTSSSSDHRHGKRDIPPDWWGPLTIFGGVSGTVAGSMLLHELKEARILLRRVPPLLADCLDEMGRYPADPRKPLQQRLVECCQREDIDVPLRHCEKILPPGFARALAEERARHTAARSGSTQDAAPGNPAGGDLTTGLTKEASTDGPLPEKSSFEMNLGDIGQSVKDSIGSAFSKDGQARQPLLGGSRSGPGMRLRKPGL